ncbi:hypothetical protein QLS71_012310 [Mariniflexile litorale]|uniref:Uncharacterized protein n=1 Tax=Mariniflexile litorale TaxID=3045158 RepID=A0AAU7EBU7_9FLAO|nr:hypothetical protein [Mariniflexile sp. KMM 9835]MDQ8210445.1 hypothetical protein [Mariniflexile sp. KMM 9835]
MIKYSLFVFLLIGSKMFSQVGIGTTAPRAALEISNTTGGGVLIPKYALTVSNDTATVINPQGGSLEKGTLIYNTANIVGANSISEGFFDSSICRWNSNV